MGQLLSFNLDNDNYKVEIMSHATKATGNNPDWYNFMYHHPEPEKGKSSSTGFRQVENLKFENVLKRQYMKF